MNSEQLLKEAITETFISFSTHKKLGLATSAKADKFYKAVCKKLLVNVTIENVKRDIELYENQKAQAQTNSEGGSY